MLTYLRIRDLALIEEVTLEPGSGLHALTGETGAGKSILLDGLALLAGARASLEQLRQGADRAVIEGVFDLSARPDVQELLRSQGWSDGDSTVVLRRTIAAGGSRATINDRLVTVAALRQLGDLLVDIAGQHESQQLLRPAAQLRLLDRYAGLEPARRQVETLFDDAGKLRARLEALRGEERERAQRADYLRFQIQEIDAAGLSEQEEAELHGERQRLRHAEELAELAGEALELLYEGEGSALELLDRAQRALARIGRLDASAELGLEGLQEAAFAVEEAARRLQPYRDALEADPERLSAIEARLASIDGLRRKYGDSVAEILARAEQARAELATLEGLDEQLEQVAGRLRRLAREYDEAACALTAAREQAARRLQEEITEQLQGLGMQGARFVARLRPNAPETDTGLPPGASRVGYEGVEFLLAANPGEPAKALARVASGGELSRVMLALKLAEIGGAAPTTLVFDEVDAGVGGGRVAERLAERLERLGQAHQVLVVTHLPQIAARATHHLLVHKGQRDERTVVRVATLGGSERVDELARMLGGVQITDSVREHARDLLGGRG